MATMKICNDCPTGSVSMVNVEMTGRPMPFAGSTTSPTPMDGAANVVGSSGNRGFGFPTDSQGAHVPLPKMTPAPEKFFG